MPDKNRTDWGIGDRVSFIEGFNNVLSGVITAVFPKENLADVKLENGIEYSCYFKELRLDGRA